MQQHLAECPPCAEEYTSARQVKILLRSLSLPDAEASLETRILTRLAQEDRRSESLLPVLPSRVAFSTLRAVPVVARLALPAPSRGRRLTASLALSCLAVLAVAAPFAPSTPAVRTGLDRAALGQTALVEPIPSAGLAAVSADGPWARPAEAVIGPPSNSDAPSIQEAAFVRRDAQPPLTDAGVDPLGDAAASGYVSGDVAFAGYRTR